VSGDAGWSAWPAPAKLNLFLRITGRRPDGYHLLQTVFQLLDWGDTVELRPRADGRLVRDGGDTAGLPEDQDLLLRAARALQAATGTAQGADLRATKRIPAGGGMGGGSSDAASVLVGLDALWGTGLAPDALAGIGLALGADVPVFVHGRNAWAEGIGEALRPIELAPAWYLVVDPGVGAPTGALFQAADLTRDAAPATMRDFVSGRPLGNAFEPVLRRQQPAVNAALIALARFGAPQLTGSGSACFLRFDSAEAADAARERLPGGLRAWTCAGAGRSALLDALAHWRRDGTTGLADSGWCGEG
jgi:4-diphosphocytidyl-2-C-methyl-D-erythritol kinase